MKEESFGERFGRLVRQYRGEQGITIEKLAEEADVSARAIGDIEKGKTKTPRARMREALCRALNIDPEDIERLNEPLNQAASDETFVKTPQPRLSDPPRRRNDINYYGTRHLETLIGRDTEMQQLRSFLSSLKRFQWMQLAGVGGQGKSRLALELSLEAKNKGWSAGLLETDDLKSFDPHWPTWQPDRPQLIVVDYVLGREDDLAPMFRTLCRRGICHDTAFDQPVRLLFVERQPWNRGGEGLQDAHRPDNRERGPNLSLSGESRATWFLKLADRYDGRDGPLMETRFQDGIQNGVLEVRRLSKPELIEIVRTVARSVNKNIGNLPSGVRIAQDLERMDDAGRPLYAYFLGQAIAAGQGTQEWSRKDLLDDALTRERGTRWAAAFRSEPPFIGDPHPAMRIALLATIVRGLDCRRAVRDQLLEPPDSTTRRQSLVLNGGEAGERARGPTQQIPGLQPDLLGEWLVLSAIDGGISHEDIFNPAWCYDPKETATFIQRLIDDFPRHGVTHDILAMALPNEGAQQALANVSAAIFDALRKINAAVSPPLIDALQRQATKGDSHAMTALGLAHHDGRGVPQSDKKAESLWRQAVKRGNARAMNSLGWCYHCGRGVEKDEEEAVAWYRKGADAGDARAMSNLGWCFNTGHGVEKDEEQAVVWYRKAADLGDAGAMFNLGWCYQHGHGVEKDEEEAVARYRKAADEGYAGAMFNLGWCYQHGHGVEKDEEEAVARYRKAADAGEARAMGNLGLCYEYGRGVEKDEEKAVAFYRNAADAGDAVAMGNLGMCYQYGDGVEKDKEQAVVWYRKAADAGNAIAKALLARLLNKDD